MVSQVDLLVYCRKNNLPVFSALGAAAKSDPSRIQVSYVLCTLSSPSEVGSLVSYTATSPRPSKTRSPSLFVDDCTFSSSPSASVITVLPLTSPCYDRRLEGVSHGVPVVVRPLQFASSCSTLILPLPAVLDRKASTRPWSPPSCRGRVPKGQGRRAARYEQFPRADLARTRSDSSYGALLPSPTREQG
jgi:hypothetical protein